MIMVIGGAYQGKASYARNLYPDIKWIDGAECGFEEIYSCEGILHFHKYIKRAMRSGMELAAFAKELTERNPDLILTSDEIGYGIVPIDPFEREYREKTGRICTELAAFSKEVHRVICGIGTVIKG